MPPKKDNKKKGGGSGPKEVDSEAYVRQVRRCVAPRLLRKIFSAF